MGTLWGFLLRKVSQPFSPSAGSLSPPRWLPLSACLSQHSPPIPPQPSQRGSNLSRNGRLAPELTSLLLQKLSQVAEILGFLTSCALCGEDKHGAAPRTPPLSSAVPPWRPSPDPGQDGLWTGGYYGCSVLCPQPFSASWLLPGGGTSRGAGLIWGNPGLPARYSDVKFCNLAFPDIAH